MSTELIGRACDLENRDIHHLFGAYGDPAVVSAWPDFTRTIDTTWSIGRTTGVPRLYSISSRTRSVQRYDANNAITSLSISGINASNAATAKGFAKLALRLGGGLAQQRILIDTDQKVEVWADFVDVALLVPGTVQSLGSASAEAPGGQLVVDELVGCEVAAINVSNGCRTASLTEHRGSIADQREVVRVPRGAVSLRIDARPGDTAGDWSTWLGDPTANGRIVGSIPVGVEVDIGSITHIFSDTESADRFFSLTWQIKP